MPVSRYTFRTVNLRRFALLVAVVVAMFGAGYALHRMQVKRNADVMLQSARNNRANGSINEALSLYERYLNFQPRNAEVLAEYAIVLDDAVKTQPNRVKELFDLYERILTADPKRSADRRKLIDKYIERRAFSRAQGHIETLLKEEPSLVQDAGVMDQYGLCAQRLGQNPQAIDRYRLAIETGKAPSETYLRLVHLLQAEGGKHSQDEARKLLDRLIVDKPRDPAARLARARYFQSQKQNAEAIRELQTAMDGSPDAAKSQELVILLADLQREAKNLPAARDVLTKAVAAQPENALLKLVLANLLDHLGDRPQAEKLLREAIRIVPPENPLALEVLDRMIEIRDLPTAREEIRRRYADKPGHFADYLNGKLALGVGDWPTAQAKLTAALPGFDKLPRLAARTHEALGHCAKAANNPERMAASYSAALTADPLLDSARLGLAEANARLGKGSEAADTFRKFAADSPEARAMLARLALEEQLTKPADRRDWSEFTKSLGPAPHPPAIELLRIVAERSQNHTAAAIDAAKKLIESHPESLPGYLSLAALQSETDATAALATLTTAAAKLGDKVEIRLARANVLASQPKPDAARIVELADNATDLRGDDRYALDMGLAGILLRRLDQPAEAATLLKRAGEARPNDVVSRTRLVELLLRQKKYAEAEGVIDELRKLEGVDGPSYLFAVVARGALAHPSAAALADLRAKIGEVLKARPTWGRAALLAAELDDTAGDGDAALERYRRAFTLGERPTAAVQRLVTLLVTKRRFEDARRVLAEAEQTIGLSDELRRQGSLLDAVAEKPGPKADDFLKQKAESSVAADQVFRGQLLLLAAKPKDAVAAYEKAIAIDAASADAWLGLIMATAAQGKLEPAQAVWEKAKAALAAKPPADPTLTPRVLGLGLEILGKLPAAEQIYRETLKNHPDATLMSQLAMLCQRQGRSEEAAMQYRAILASNASDALKRRARRELAWGTRGHVPAALELLAANAPPSPEDLRTQGLILSLDPYRRVEARKLIEQAAALSAPGPDDALRLADFYMRDDNPPKAEEVLREAARGGWMVPAGLLALLHQAQHKLGKESDAKATLDRLAAIAPQSWEAAVEQARVMASRGDRAEAAKKLLGHPDAREPAVRLNVVFPALVDLGCDAEALTLLKTLVATTKVPGRHAALARFLGGLEAIDAALALPDDEYPATLKAKHLTASIVPVPRQAASDPSRWDAKIEAASGWLHSAMAKNPNDAALLTLQGAIADARGDTPAAIANFEKAVALAPKSPTAANALAYLLLVSTTPDVSRAETIVSGLIAASAPDPVLLDTLALARLTQGRVKEAARDLDAALVQSPHKPVYWFRLAQIKEKAGDPSGRDLAMLKAVNQLGLKKEMLHPLEWPAFEKMLANVRRKS